MSRLSQMLKSSQSRSGKTEQEIGREFGFSQQAFQSWKKGSAPRIKMYPAIARFLMISEDDVAMLADEAKQDTRRPTTLPDIGAPIKGIGTEEYVALDKFATGFAKPIIGGTYAIRVRGRNFWINPRLAPREGNTVLLRSGDTGRLATWPVEHDGEAHVVVLAEMI